MTRAAYLRAAGLIAGALAAILVAERTVRAIEEGVTAQVSSALAAGGHGWAAVEVDGLDVALSGVAPDDAARDGAAGLALAAAPWISLTNGTTVQALPQAVERLPGRIEILRGITDVTLSGNAADEETVSAFADALRAATPGLLITDFVRRDARKGDGLAEAAPAVAVIAAGLLHGHVTVAPGVVTAAGLVESADALASASQGIQVLRDAGWQVEVSLTEPVVPASALALVFEKGPEGRGLVECAAPDRAAAEAIAARIAEMGGAGGGECSLADGAGGAEWLTAALAALDAVDAVPAGDVMLRDGEARLTAAPPTRAKALSTARAAFEARLPDGYRLVVLRAPGPEGDGAVETGEGGDAALASGFADFSVHVDGNTLTLSGFVPDTVLAGAVEAYARATIQGVAVVNEMRPLPTAPTLGWRPVAAAAVEAAAMLRHGRVDVGQDWVTLEGEAERPVDAPQLHHFLTRRMGTERRVETRIRISPARVAAKQPMPPARCAARLTEIVAADPIRFAPGSSEIDAESDVTLRQLVDVLSDCAGGAIEIAGYTDSKGPSAVNLRISRARAEAVLSALLARGAPVSALSAKGYGEASPIADNETEAGRAKNRRIEFRATGEEE